MPDDPKPIENELGDLEEIRAAAKRLEITYDIPMQTFLELATGVGHDSPTFKLRGAEELAKILRMYPERGKGKTVVESDAQEVRIYLPDNGRDEGTKDAKPD